MLVGRRLLVVKWVLFLLIHFGTEYKNSIVQKRRTTLAEQREHLTEVKWCFIVELQSRTLRDWPYTIHL